MPFQIIRNDITKVKADAIVNTANPDVAIGSGVDSAIYKAAGSERLLAERAKIGELSPGEIGVTPAFDLAAKYIIHVSGPRWQGGEEKESEVLRACYDKALDAAFNRQCESIAFPLIATGTYGFPKELGIQIAVDAFTDFLQEHEMKIKLVVFSDESVKISGKLVDEVRLFIDDNYVQKTLESEYATDSPFRNRNVSLASAQLHMEQVPEESSDGAIDSLDDALKEIYTDSFEKHLQKLINKKGLKNSQIYATADLSKQYFSKLLNGQVKPSKEKMLALVVGLRLNVDEAVDFLGIAGYALSPISQTDLIVRYFLEHKQYNVIKLNIVLFDYGLDTLT